MWDGWCFLGGLRAAKKEGGGSKMKRNCLPPKNRGMKIGRETKHTGKTVIYLEFGGKNVRT